MLGRLERELSWKPYAYTKICSDHFHAKYFLEADVETFKEGITYQRDTAGAWFTSSDRQSKVRAVCESSAEAPSNLVDPQ